MPVWEEGAKGTWSLGRAGQEGSSLGGEGRDPAGLHRDVPTAGLHPGSLIGTKMAPSPSALSTLHILAERKPTTVLLLEVYLGQDDRGLSRGGGIACFPRHLVGERRPTGPNPFFFFSARILCALRPHLGWGEHPSALRSFGLQVCYAS